MDASVNSLFRKTFSHGFGNCYLFCRWYTGKMKRQEAEAHLLEKNDNGTYINDDGAFLVRSSVSTPGDFVLSVK